MNYILFDGEYRENLLPLTYTKPVADLRIGILTIREKWEKYLESTTTSITEDYLAEKFPMVELEQNIMINPMKSYPLTGFIFLFLIGKQYICFGKFFLRNNNLGFEHLVIFWLVSKSLFP